MICRLAFLCLPAKAASQESAFESGFSPKDEANNEGADHAPPNSFREGCAGQRDCQANVNGMPQIGVRAGVDKLVIYLESRNSAPVAAQMLSRPKGQQEPGYHDQHSGSFHDRQWMDEPAVEFQSGGPAASPQQNGANNYQYPTLRRGTQRLVWFRSASRSLLR